MVVGHAVESEQTDFVISSSTKEGGHVDTCFVCGRINSSLPGLRQAVFRGPQREPLAIQSLTSKATGRSVRSLPKRNR